MSALEAPALDEPCGSKPGSGVVELDRVRRTEGNHSSGSLAWPETDPSQVTGHINYAWHRAMS
jgi:hypothetical protein